MPRDPKVKLECNRRWRANHLEQSRAATESWRRRNLDKKNATRQAWRSKRKKENWDLHVAQRRKWNLKKCFGMTVEEYNALLVEQHGGCAICGGPPLGGKKYLSVDHSHTTGVNRGLLCALCNFAVSRLEDDSNWGEKALAYLKKYEGDLS